MKEIIIAQSTVSPAGNGSRAFSVILYKRDHAFDPYVVHYQIEEKDDHARWHGGYFSSIVEAAQEFAERCKYHSLRDAAVYGFAHLAAK